MPFYVYAGSGVWSEMENGDVIVHWLCRSLVDLKGNELCCTYLPVWRCGVESGLYMPTCYCGWSVCH